MGESARPQRVVVVDDDHDIRTMLGLVLQMAGCEVTLAANGREALALLQAAPTPDVILLDLMMPLMNGWEFRAAQQADPRIAPIPVLVLSGDGRVPQKTEALGAAGYLKKPIDLEELETAVRRFR